MKLQPVFPPAVEPCKQPTSSSTPYNIITITISKDSLSFLALTSVLSDEVKYFAFRYLIIPNVTTILRYHWECSKWQAKLTFYFQPTK